MRDDLLDTVTPGARPAPLGARGDQGAREDKLARGDQGARGEEGARGDQGAREGEAQGASRIREAPDLRRIRASTRLLLVVLAGALLVYAGIATDVVHAGGLSELDIDVATWVAGSMPAWAEWIARPFTWLGGYVGMTAVVTAAAVWLLSRRARVEAALLVVVAVGLQVLVFTGKDGYVRPRPDVGSAIALPASSSFPSGHAANGIAVFGLLGILGATCVQTRAERIAAICAGFGLGVLIGASRVVLNVHYVTDVVAGWCLGLAWLIACLLVARRVGGRPR